MLRNCYERFVELPYVLILGASGALGSSLAQAYEAQGYRVLGTGFRKQVPCERSFVLDVQNSENLKAFIEWVKQQTSRLDSIVYCIGITEDQLIQKMTPSAWQAVLDVNLKGAYQVSQSLLPLLMKQRSGHFIFISSWGGRVGRMGQANYSAAKAGLIGLTQSLAREYSGRGILANCVIPGVFKSPMVESLSPEALDRLWEGAALKQFADLQEISNFIVHLSKMKGVTGQVFQLDGRISSVLG
jgi:3-oxoacyl-[acyl-carrier protein] reductase